MSQLGDCGWRTDVSTSGRRASRDLKDLGDPNLRPPAQKGRGSSTPPRCSDLRGYLDLDLLGLGFLTPRHPDRQHAGLILGADLASVDRRRQCERPRERAITALDPMELFLRDFPVELPLATQRERVV